MPTHLPVRAALALALLAGALSACEAPPFYRNSDGQQFYAEQRDDDLEPEGSFDDSEESGFEGLATSLIPDDLEDETATFLGGGITDSGDIVIVAEVLEGVVLTRFNATGADTSPSARAQEELFEDLDNYTLSGATVAGDGGVYLYGSTREDGSRETDEVLVVRLSSDGSLDRGFADNGFLILSLDDEVDDDSDDLAADLILDRDGDVYLLMQASPEDDDDIDCRLGLARLQGDGSLDPGFGGDGLITPELDDFDDLCGERLLIDSGDALVVAGVGELEGSAATKRLIAIRYSVDGVLDSGFGDDGVRVLDETDLTPTLAASNLIALDLTPAGRLVLATGASADNQVFTLDADGDELHDRFGNDGVLDSSDGLLDLAVADSGDYYYLSGSGAGTLVRLDDEGDEQEREDLGFEIPDSSSGFAFSAGALFLSADNLPTVIGIIGPGVFSQ